MTRDDSPIDPNGIQQQTQQSQAFQTPPATPRPTADRDPDTARDADIQEAAAPQRQQPQQRPEPQTEGIRDLSIWDTGKAEEFRQRWHGVQTHFVEDPRGSVTEARQLVDEAVQTLSDSVHEREDQLERDGARSSDSTEGMRDAVLQYHHLLDRLLAV